VPAKFNLNLIARTYYTIYCTGTGTGSGSLVFPNFNLETTKGGKIGIYYTNKSNVVTAFDSVSYPLQTSGSYGRYPDGSDTWSNFTTPTPGAPNK
jgi:hypothetical protein